MGCHYCLTVGGYSVILLEFFAPASPTGAETTQGLHAASGVVDRWPFLPARDQPGCDDMWSPPH